MTSTINPEVLAAQLETAQAKLALKDNEINAKQDEITKLFVKNQNLEAELGELRIWKKKVIVDFKIPMG